ncbi:MAG: hypothetical protein ABR915_24730, partial [Thermoguttaceae bacterium]
QAGQSRVNATLGGLSSVAPLLIDIGGTIIPSTTLLVAVPNPMGVWTGQTTRFGSVRIDPANGSTPFPVAYRLVAPDGQGIVKVDGENNVTGLAPGTTQVTVIATDPKYQGLSRQVTVEVGTPDSLSFDPPQLSLGVGEVSQLIRVLDSSRIAVPALVETTNPSIVDRVPSSPGCFVGKALGQTDLKATYRGKEVSMTVSVTGKRFQGVKTTVNKGQDDFTAEIEVLAAESEGELEYRVYRAGGTPEENWVPNQPDAGGRKVTLRSPPIPYGKANEVYPLVVEARDKAGKSVEQFPLALESSIVIQARDKK